MPLMFGLCFCTFAMDIKRITIIIEVVICACMRNHQPNMTVSLDVLRSNECILVKEKSRISFRLTLVLLKE